MNANICAVLTRDDMNYWGMDELALEPCCAGKLTNRQVLKDVRLSFTPNSSHHSSPIYDECQTQLAKVLPLRLIKTIQTIPHNLELSVKSASLY